MIHAESGDFFNRAELIKDLQAVRTLYRDAGFLKERRGGARDRARFMSAWTSSSRSSADRPFTSSGSR